MGLAPVQWTDVECFSSFVTDYSECATIKRKADSAIYMFTGIQNT